MDDHLALLFAGNPPEPKRLASLQRLCMLTVLGPREMVRGLPVEHVALESIDIEAAREAFVSLEREPCCVGAFDDAALPLSAALADELGFPHWSCAAVSRSSTNKVMMRMRQRECGIPVPEFISVSKLDKTVIAEAIAEMGPVVIKPACGEFSQGVRYLERPDEFNYCEYQNAIANARRAGYVLKDGPWLIEQYIEGTMVSVEGVIIDGIVHILGRVANEMGPLPNFEIVSNRLPAPLTAGEQAALDDAASAAAYALGDGPGFFHCELRLSGSKATVIEIAARVPGGLLPDSYQRAIGLDLYRIQLDLWNGRAPDLAMRSRFHILQKACYAPPASRISRMAGAEAVGGIDGLWQFRALLASGQVTGDAKQVKIPAYYYGVESFWPERLDDLARQVEDGIGLIHEPLCTDGQQTG
jgi:hypothetical protein